MVFVNSNAKSDRSGFTLLELMIAVGIIVILATVINSGETLLSEAVTN